MGRGEVERRAKRDDAGGVDLMMRDIIVALDVLKIDGFSDAGQPIKVQ